MIRTTNRFAAAALGLLLVASACNNETVNRPFANTPVDPLFERYVSMGNSITAGYQSAGILDSTQQQSYAVLLAQSMHSPFFAPLMQRPGCPPPYDSLFSSQGAPVPHRLGPAVPGGCALRRTLAQPAPFVSNVAVPGAKVLDTYANLGAGTSANALTTFILGGLTQMQMLRRAGGTFVTVWIGNNDVLGAATDTANAGNPALVTDTTVFKTEYAALLDSIATTDVAGGVLIGVANVTLIPYFVRGSKFYNVKFSTDSIPGPNAANKKFPANFLVDPNCAPPAGDSVLVPYPRGAAVLAFARVTPAATVGVDCSDVHHVSRAEMLNMVTAVNSYNAFIQAQATARGYAYIDPNALFGALPAGAIPAFPNVPAAGNTPAFAAAYATPFGSFFSKDGVHPNAVAHRLIAGALVTAINATYTTAIPPIP
jgi:lysophospholipase L1-like esterase